MPSKSLKITVKDRTTNLLVKGQGVIIFNRTSTTNTKFAFFNNMFDSSDYVEKFEKEFSEYTGAKHTLLVNSISSAKFLLFASLKEFAGLKDDDKILVPINGWSSNINAVIQNNLKPVFADVTLQNLCISEKDLIAIRKTYPDIKVIFTGHTLGFLSNTRSLREEFQYSIIIEDCCDALGLKDLQKIQVGSDSLAVSYTHLTLPTNREV